MTWFQKLRARLDVSRHRVTLDALLAPPAPSQPLADRVAWAEDVLAWLRREASATRLRHLLQTLERQPETGQRIAQTLRSLVRDTQALDLFADTGLPQGTGFFPELYARLALDLLPEPPDTRDLADIFDRLFPHASDADWLMALPDDLPDRVVALFHQAEAPAEAGWASLRADLEDAMVQLTDRICVLGSHREMRARLGKLPFRDLPFQKLPPAVEALFAHHHRGAGLNELTAELNLVRALGDSCDRAVDDVIRQLEKTGVSTSLVYNSELLRAQLQRLDLLLEAWASPVPDARRTLTLLADLVRQNHDRRSVRELFRQNLHLLTRRIVERNAEAGEHYVARNGREYAAMLRSAAGGGAVMGVTTIVKLLLAKLGIAGFFRGALFGTNYAASFVLIQLGGFTVATKQPATTAPALAQRMHELRTAPQLDALVDEVVFLIRSQIAAVCGNLALVLPVTLALAIGWSKLVGHPLVDEHKAQLLVAAVLPWNGCWIFAAFTGGLLWLSSVIAAYADNWFVLHHLGPALAQHRTWQRLLGPTPTRRLAVWFEHNIAGLAGNISLGLMLGLAPEIATFFGVPLDIRHVTLSAGQTVAALLGAGPGQFPTLTIGWAVVGILGIGALNILVSFGLALFVAIRARNVRGPERRLFYRALALRFLRSPFSFLLPVGKISAPATVPAPS